MIRQCRFYTAYCTDYSNGVEERSNKSSVDAEMAAQCCTSRIVKRWSVSVRAKNRGEARIRGHQSHNAKN